jgi:hypothetical protein
MKQLQGGGMGKLRTPALIRDRTGEASAAGEADDLVTVQPCVFTPDLNNTSCAIVTSFPPLAMSDISWQLGLTTMCRHKRNENLLTPCLGYRSGTFALEDMEDERIYRGSAWPEIFPGDSTFTANMGLMRGFHMVQEAIVSP